MADDVSFEISRIINESEAKRQFRLTLGARMMLEIPIVELLQPASFVSPNYWTIVKTSISRILDDMYEEDFPAHFARRESRDSIDVIQSFHRRFCSIPPFCDRNIL
ncbi:MAG TPA: hypothetical protein VKT73_11085 [Xanthobacteraceae bacterium]|nr:hypothetical protein [Xanthobacteraceae bacterium]